MIDVNTLKFCYPGQSQPALNGLSFRVEDGEIFGFLGPSGAGKTTAQKLLIGLLKDYTGDISILGKDARQWGTDMYEHIGAGFELPNHFSQLTGLEKIL